MKSSRLVQLKLQLTFLNIAGLELLVILNEFHMWAVSDPEYFFFLFNQPDTK